MIDSPLTPRTQSATNMLQFSPLDDPEHTIEVILPGLSEDDAQDGDDSTDDTDREPSQEEEMFYRNVAEDLDSAVLAELSSIVGDFYTDDLASRDDWSKTYENGVKLLGLGIEERTAPWEGACGVYHPLMAEAAVRFQAESITELFKAQGICKTTIIGTTTKQKEEAAKRVENDINWRMTTQMKEYRAEHERMLWNLAIMGSAFKKVYYDPALGRQTSVFVSAEDLVVPYGASDIYSAERISHHMKKSKNDVLKLQIAGFYRDVMLDTPPGVSATSKNAEDRVTGRSSINDDRLDIIEMQVDLDLEGYEDVDEDGEFTGIARPWVVTFDLHTQDILAVYRNWKHDDENKLRTQHFVHYVYIPGFGFYGMGLVHLCGGFASSATSILRQLVDAGTLSNLPAGFKTKGVRFQRDSDPLAPGEFRDVDVPSGNLRDAIIPLPYKEPSSTLMQLFTEVVEEGRRMAAVSDLNAADMNQEAPVGTTLAILERSLKVMSAIQARLHAALKEELTLLKDIIRDQLPEKYDYDVDEGRRIKQADYDHAEIIPVSDPNAATMSQRVVQYQAVMQLAQANPAIYDMVELNRQMLDTLGIKNVERLIPSAADMTPKDPVIENMNILVGKPVKAFAYQDHQSHLTVHMTAQQDPHMQQIIGQNPMASTIAAALSAHIAEHVAMEYRNQIEAQLGAPLPQGDEQMSPETERQLSAVMAQAASQLLQQSQAQMKTQQAQQAQQDPVMQIQQAQLQNDTEANRIKAQVAQDNYNLGTMRIQADMAKHATNPAMQPAPQAPQAAPSPQLQQAQQVQQLQHTEATHQQAMQHAQQQHTQKQATGNAAMGQQEELHQQKIADAQSKRALAALMSGAQAHIQSKGQK